MDPLQSLLAPLLHSPQLPEAVSRLQQLLDGERQRRKSFYEQMTPDQKVEFIEGEVVPHSPARNRHLDVTKYACFLIDSYVRVHQLGTVKFEKCLCVFPRNDYEPDVVYFGSEKSRLLTPDTMKFPVPDLVVEVLSASTEARDRGVKFEDFAVNQVGEYWLLDGDQDVVEQYVLDNGQFKLLQKSSTGKLRSKVIAGFEIDITALFDEHANLAAIANVYRDSAGLR